MLNIDRKVYDVIGIGIGPFNLGMAAMMDGLPQLSSIFFDQSDGFNWHAGMMLPNARLQVPFYADLVTVVDPCSRFSYLNYLKQKQRLFRFAIHENNFVTRREYNDYCRWVVDQLDNLHFNHKVVDVHYEVKDETYTVMVHNLSSDSLSFYYAKHLVVGVGSVPKVPECVNGRVHSSSNREIASSHMQLPNRMNLAAPRNDGPFMVHSSDYLFRKDDILEQGDITIVGSGQSAAEIFYDLLQYSDHLESLHWFTRSERFYPMEYSKLSLEMTSPDYVDHFYSLPQHQKKAVLRKQNALYKGINFSLINEIYDALYLRTLDGEDDVVCLHPNTELKELTVKDNLFQLQFYHSECETEFVHETKALILATGYQSCVPQFLSSIKDHLLWQDDGLYQVNRNYSIDVIGKKVFVQNAELHSHGFSAPDLGMGPYRNAVILNSILGYEYFVMEQKVGFQRFGVNG